MFVLSRSLQRLSVSSFNYRSPAVLSAQGQKCLSCQSGTRHTDKKQSFYITTPIFYVNSVPHIGHLYSATLADAIARWKRIKGKHVVFSTGTDEHGLKVQQAAAKKKKQPQHFCDEISQSFKDLFSLADISYSDYIRTTEPRHKDTVYHIWNKLKNGGHIYKGHYEGWYSTSDEAFLTAEQVMDHTDSNGNNLKVSKESGHPVEWMKEDNYMFRLSAFSQDLKKWIQSHDVIEPSKFRITVERWLDEGLPDLSVSRQRDRLQWGLPVPSDPKQTIYVWLDALVNYLTVIGYPQDQTFWPAQCHVIGKDILKFHAIYWPAFLIAAELPLPEQIFCHSHWTINNLKMSKSRGNVVDPGERIRRYSSDGLRYFLLREGVPHSDGNYNDEKLITYLNSELANTLGNLLSRCTAQSLNPSQIIPGMDQDIFDKMASPEDTAMWQQLQTLPDVVDEHYCSYNFYKGIDAILAQLRETNTFIQRHKPWELKADNTHELTWRNTVLSVAITTLRVSGILLQPIIPRLSDKLLQRLSVGENERSFDSLKINILQTGQKEQPLGNIQGVFFARLKS